MLPSFCSDALPDPPSKPVYTDEELSVLKKEVRRAAHCLREETASFIEHQVELHPKEPPRVPIFFIKGFNFLKEECACISHHDRVIDFLPQALEMIVLTESGPPPPGTMPVLQDGRLVEPSADGSLWTEIGRFFSDITEYCRNTFHVTGALPRLPHSYIMTLIHFQRRFIAEEQTVENFTLICSIPDLMQKYITQALGEHNVPADYIKRGEDLVYHQF